MRNTDVQLDYFVQHITYLLIHYDDFHHHHSSGDHDNVIDDLLVHKHFDNHPDHVHDVSARHDNGTTIHNYGPADHLHPKPTVRT